MKPTMNILIFSIASIAILAFLLLIPIALRAQTLKPKIKHYIEYTKPIEYLSDPLVGWSAFYGTSSADDAAESFNAKVKSFRAQFRGVRDIPFSSSD